MQAPADRVLAGRLQIRNLFPVNRGEAIARKIAHLQCGRGFPANMADELGSIDSPGQRMMRGESQEKPTCRHDPISAAGPRLCWAR